MLEVGALTTMTPAWVAAWTSTLSRPTPARATTLRLFAAASASASILVAERTRTASTSARAGSSSSRSAPSQWRISKSGPRASMVAGESSSAMRTTGLVTCQSFGVGHGWSRDAPACGECRGGRGPRGGRAPHCAGVSIRAGAHDVDGQSRDMGSPGSGSRHSRDLPPTAPASPEQRAVSGRGGGSPRPSRACPRAPCRGSPRPSARRSRARAGRTARRSRRPDRARCPSGTGRTP